MAVVNFKGALRSYVLADATVATLIGLKFYSPAAPQGTLAPYATFQKIDKDTFDNLSGFQDVVQERWQIDAYGTDGDNTEAIAKAIFDRLHMKIYETWSGYKIHLSKYDSENDFSELDIEGGEKNIHRIQQDFLIKRSYEKI